MKKYLLGLLAIPFSLITFTSAVDINCENGNCTNSFNAGAGICDGGKIIAKFNGNVNCGGGNTTCSIIYEGEQGEIYYIGFSNGQLDENSRCDMNYNENINFTLTQNNDIENLNGLTLGITNGGGNEGGNEGGGIIEGGINAFSGIIERLGNIFGEFGPYIIYIAIACLGISLLFKALKYILGFTNNSAKNSIGGREGTRKTKRLNKGGYTGMRNRRTRRRRERRLKRYINKYEGGNNQLKFGNRGYNSRK